MENYSVSMGNSNCPKLSMQLGAVASLSKKEYHFVKMHQNHFVKFTTPHGVSNTWEGSFCPTGKKNLTSHAEEFLPALPRPPDSAQRQRLRSS